MAAQGCGGSSGRFSFSEINAYLWSRSYPQGLDKSGKSVLRRRAKSFNIDQGDLYYIGGGNDKLFHLNHFIRLN